MSTMNRLTLKSAFLLLALVLTVFAAQLSLPAPAKACTWMWGVNFTYDYYSDSTYTVFVGSCHEDCYANRTCWGEQTSYVIFNMGECYYCG
jgi:hypothetical protein